MKLIIHGRVGDLQGPRAWLWLGAMGLAWVLGWEIGQGIMDWLGLA